LYQLKEVYQIQLSEVYPTTQASIDISCVWSVK